MFFLPKTILITFIFPIFIVILFWTIYIRLVYIYKFTIWYIKKVWISKNDKWDFIKSIFLLILLTPIFLEISYIWFKYTYALITALFTS